MILKPSPSKLDDNLYFIQECSDNSNISDTYICTDKTTSYDPQHIVKISMWALYMDS